MLEKRNFYINGEWVSPDQANDFPVVNPSSEEVCGIISLGNETDVDLAVDAASEAFTDWGNSSKQVRLGFLNALLKVYNDRAEEMARLISLEMGAPISMARESQVVTGATNIQTAISALEKFEFDYKLDPKNAGINIFHEPIGVVGLITPWNWPMNQVTLKVAPAIAAGCTMVLKPSEIAPFSSLFLAELIDSIGLPPGVFNLINGNGEGVGSKLSGHQKVHMVSFTGSARAGTEVSKAAASTIKRVTLELGGKGANIVFDDADEKAVSRGVRHCFNNSGQSCNAPTRMLVSKNRYEEAVRVATRVAEETEVRGSEFEGKHIGPVISEVQYNKIQNFIQKGIDEGARLVAGGLGKPNNLKKGYFVKPTVFADVTPEMTIACDEIFGPVLCLMPFTDEQEAYKISNDTSFGLTNYIQTTDLVQAKRAAKSLRSGVVEINGQSRGPWAPFGGYKQSGNGREGGVWGLEEFLEVKAVSGLKD